MNDTRTTRPADPGSLTATRRSLWRSVREKIEAGDQTVSKREAKEIAYKRPSRQGPFKAPIGRYRREMLAKRRGKP